MIHIFKTPTCAYCVQVMRVLDHWKIRYEVHEAEGEQYTELAYRFGMTVPLVYNDIKGMGMVGYDIPKLKALTE